MTGCAGCTLAARRRLLGDEHPDTLSSMNNLAETLGALGARELYEQTLAARRRLLGDDAVVDFLSARACRVKTA